LQQLLNDPAGDDEIILLMDYLTATQRPIGIILTDVPHQDLLLAEKILHYAEPDSLMYDEWQMQQKALQEIGVWKRGPGVMIGSANLLPHLGTQDAIPTASAPWENYYQWLPTSVRPSFAQELPTRTSNAANKTLRIFPLAVSDSSSALTQPLLWSGG